MITGVFKDDGSGRGPTGRSGVRDHHVQEPAVPVNWTLEVVCVPVSDVHRAKAFYAAQVGFNVDYDTVQSDDVRVVQLTPPGSGCSIVIGKGAFPDKAPGSLKGLQLVVADIGAAHSELFDRGVDVTGIHVFGADGPRPSRAGDVLDNVGFFYFSDPDGNGWAVQQISDRAG
jgi:catechol 2,3-dioxygenase-like lactoylglutathione lyase family enzyme